MKTNHNRRGLRAVQGKNHEGRKINKAKLVPTAPAFDAGTTKSRIIQKMETTGITTCRCWCERTDVSVSLEQVQAGRTGSCGTARCRIAEQATS